LQKRQLNIKKSAIGEIDPTIDLLATEEESIRGRTHEERAGYGLGAREADEEAFHQVKRLSHHFLCHLEEPAEAEEEENAVLITQVDGLRSKQLRKRKREASQTIDSVNDHSMRVTCFNKNSCSNR
jgi:hypothetical protein